MLGKVSRQEWEKSHVQKETSTGSANVKDLFIDGGMYITYLYS